MPARIRALGCIVAGGLWASSACTVKDAPEPPPPSETGGTSSDGGTVSSGGKGGSGKSGAPGKGGTAGRPTEDGGAGGEAPRCAECESGLCLADGTCVDCLPADDQCPTGEYCSAEDNTCMSGCKADGSTCASGRCGDDHSCENCISDDECAGDLVCGDGVCAAACKERDEGTTKGCEDGLTCCDLHCTTLLVDSSNCGSCGNACQDDQFCGQGECTDVTLSNVCAVTKVVVILDTSKNPADGNRATGRAIGSALEELCPTTPKSEEAEQEDVEALNFSTGQPVSNGGQLLVVAGGPFFQVVEGYLETERIAPLYWKVLPAATEYRKTRDDKTVISLDIDGDHDSRDMFIIQFMRDPKSGSLILNAQGFWLSGTVAAAYHVEHTVLPNLAIFDQAWYAYSWIDKDGDLAPDENEIEEVASGR